MDIVESSKLNRLKRKTLLRNHTKKRRLTSTLNQRGAVENRGPSSSTILQDEEIEDNLADGYNAPIALTEDIQHLDLREPDLTCQFCEAIFWHAERLKMNSSTMPLYSTCCRGGKINLPLLKPTPLLLDELLTNKQFQKDIRTYNSMFAFSSLGGKIDNTINRTPGPYVIRLGGQNYHRIGSLLPTNGEPPKFSQMYIHDTDNEVFNRMMAVASNHNDSIDEKIVRELIIMFDDINEIAKAFRMARDRFQETDIRPIKLRLCSRRRGDGVEYNAPISSEIAGLIVGNAIPTFFPLW